MYKATPTWKTCLIFEASTFPGCDQRPRWKCRWFWASWPLADRRIRDVYVPRCTMENPMAMLDYFHGPSALPKRFVQGLMLGLVASNYTPNLISVGMICIDLPQMCWQARKSVIKSQRLWYTKQILHRNMYFSDIFRCLPTFRNLWVLRCGSPAWLVGLVDLGKSTRYKGMSRIRRQAVWKSTSSSWWKTMGSHGFSLSKWPSKIPS